MKQKHTREIRIGSVFIGASHPVAVQSMCATKTQDVSATLKQVIHLTEAGAKIVRIAVDSPRDAVALEELARQISLLPSEIRTKVNLSVDLQENFRLAEQIAPFVAKIRYNPGHLNHLQKDIPWREKVRWLAEIAKKHEIALRIGVNCGSIDAEKEKEFSAQERKTERLHPMLASALEHADWLEEIGFTRFCVSLKDSDPRQVISVNTIFAEKRPDIPLHLGVTEAGVPPLGIQKSRAALEPLLFSGIGDTLRISLTVPNERKHEEILAGMSLLADVEAGRRTVTGEWKMEGLNIISCPSCSRVQNSRFVELAERVHQETQYAKDFPIIIAVMGCRVNGPGETDHADLGLWCGSDTVNLKSGGKLLGTFAYEEILQVLKHELNKILSERGFL
ncbi:MAG: flavodoxin/ferredoxin-dependent (E)-4-hydroxy-3-methylbut-2-enyl-diphosphate synthase [Planctomycetia bacterium]|nr:flavodoxin/ferredoxin-dependent (E)-4-hydroxy-3-methylbut-2-enyl-diphosphate synthase [Planctomycetia bacterium]